MKIIVLNKVDYAEKDTIIDAISEEGPISFKVRGGQNAGAAFAWINNPLTVADVEYVENSRYRHQILKGAVMLDTMLIKGDYNEFLTISLIREVMMRMLQPEERAKMFDTVLKIIAASKNKNDNLLACLIFMAKAIRISGAELEVNQCVFCGSKSDIVNFSFNEGGFICRQCMREDISIDLNPAQMQLVRAIFLKDISNDLPEENISVEDKEKLLILLTEYIRDMIGVTLDTPKLIIDNLRQ